ncbi:TetR/AcrR family transcriptional regulator [Streptococcus hyointestinalis]|uniref:TetR/AcrR family transcriptional regulator n=1 Tax=Streptococcus hyointestinalis TaxID=1337 RepID=UPI003514552F
MTTVRKLRTRRQIYHAAGKLLQDIPYDKLRATQIAEEALISRSGFYLYFSDKDAMVSFYYDFLIRKVTAIYDAHRKDAADVDQALIEVVAFLQDEELFAALLGDHSTPVIREKTRENIRMVAMAEIVDYYKLLGFDLTNMRLDKTEMEYYQDIIVDSIISILMCWFTRRKAERPERVAGMIREFLIAFTAVSRRHFNRQYPSEK